VNKHETTKIALTLNKISSELLLQAHQMPDAFQAELRKQMYSEDIIEMCQQLLSFANKLEDCIYEKK